MNTDNFKQFLLNISNNSVKYFIVFDLETTGVNIGHDRITQISAMKYDIQTMKPIEKLNQMINPGNEVNIGLGAYMKTGYTIKDLKKYDRFMSIADDVYNFFSGKETAIIGYNIKNFDIPFLNTELSMCGHVQIDFTNRYIYDCFEIEREITSMNQSDVFERYFSHTPEEVGLKAHDAMSDIKMSLMIAIEQSNKYNNIINKLDCSKYNIIDNASFVDYIILTDSIFDDINNKPVLGFKKGKYKGCPVKLVNLYDPSYIAWLYSERSPISKQTQEIVRKELKQQ